MCVVLPIAGVTRDYCNVNSCNSGDKCKITNPFFVWTFWPTHALEPILEWHCGQVVKAFNCRPGWNPTCCFTGKVFSLPFIPLGDKPLAERTGLKNKHLCLFMSFHSPTLVYAQDNFECSRTWGQFLGLSQKLDPGQLSSMVSHFPIEDQPTFWPVTSPDPWQSWMLLAVDITVFLHTWSQQTKDKLSGKKERPSKEIKELSCLY